MPWDRLYDLRGEIAYRDSLPLLQLPDLSSHAPVLESRESLSDSTFSIVLAGWHNGAGRTLDSPKLVGAVFEQGGQLQQLSRLSWQVVEHIASFHRRAEEDRNEHYHRRSWGVIRQAALAANARLDDFLFRSVVLIPEKLELGFRKVDSGDTTVVEIIPSFRGAPDTWIETFDRMRGVPDRYDIPTAEGIVQIVVNPQVKTVLQQIKRLSARRVAGKRAEAFIANPFATLGEDASSVVDPEQFEQARLDAGLAFERFAAHVEKDAVGYPMQVGLLISSGLGRDPEKPELRLFESDLELEEFVRLAQSKLASELQFCGWEGYDFAFDGDSALEVELLSQALAARRKPRVLVSYSDVHDLTRYAERVEDIGVDKPYYSPFIAKKKEDEGWFPENVVPVICWTPDGDSEPVAVPITDEAREQLQAKVAQAKKAGDDTFTLAGFDKPIPVKEAEFLLQTFAEALRDVAQGVFDPERQSNRTASRRNRPSLVIRANIQSIDYKEARQDILFAIPAAPTLPHSLRADARLKEHQLTGLAWLQHLYRKAPDYCRGAVLADDMGLGKTLQLLALIAWVLEDDPKCAPALVVAPLSLLENWEEEALRFFEKGSLPVLTAYGNQLSELRVPRSNIGAQLQSEGLVKFLRPGWRDGAKVVLTTYESLRDLEFSFAAETWSIMVCDEAQKIKNPNALITRAAKKQKVRFKVACTGTPVENTLADLWCLFDFVQPALLGALNDFGRRYRRPIEAETDEEKARVEELRHIIRPQILRRTKADVAKDLPKKTSVSARIPISGHQRSLYGHAIQLFKKRSDPAVKAPFKNHLGLLHYLRLICTDPRRIGFDVFVPDPLHEYRARAPKLDWLIGILSGIKEREEKAIIFCEFRNIQRLLKHYVKEVFDYSPDIINGDTVASGSHSASRQKRIKTFQASAGFGVLILSPIAVGFGVNIQEANHVIHYTRTWNPAKEDQATDRAHRIGQVREVFVYCPVVYADDFVTFEVKLDALLQSKRSLAEDMLNGSGDVQPSEFRVDDVTPGDDPLVSAQVTLDDALRMRWDAFECLVAAIWTKKGYNRVYRTPAIDDGVDVVAISGRSGELVQCKSSGVDDADLSWDAVKDVVAGEAAYRLRHPGVEFRKACVTNQHFNSTTVTHAALNHVDLYDQERLEKFLQQYPVTMLDVERFLYTNWDHAFESS